MPVVNLGSVKAKTQQLAYRITESKAPRALTVAATIGQAYSQMLTPVDTGNLFGSMFRRMKNSQHGWKCTVGYTAEYAHAVHEASGKLKGQPRRNFGKTKDGIEFGGGTGKGNYWDPDAEPGFLRKGFANHRAEIDDAVRRALTL